MGLLETHWHLRGPLGTYADLWGPCGPMGLYGDLEGSLGTYGAQWGL